MLPLHGPRWALGAHPQARIPICDDQASTALAETPGSRFTDECEALLREERCGDLLDKFAQNLELVLSKSPSDQGDSEARCGDISPDATAAAQLLPKSAVCASHSVLGKCVCGKYVGSS